jgi:carboxymethylenebutenolidase
MARWETIRVDGQPMRVYVAAPDGGEAAPGVVVIMHGPGLERFMEDRVEELARQGYAAACPDLYHRQPQDDGADMMTRVGRLRDAEIIADVDAAIAYLRRPTTWKAAGVFYGGNIMKPWGDGPAPFDLTKSIACPVIGFFGLDDTNPSPADVDKIDAELTRHGKAHEFHRYAGAGHAFLNFANAERYRPDQAKDAWSKMLGFLSRHVKGGPAH